MLTTCGEPDLRPASTPTFGQVRPSAIVSWSTASQDYNFRRPEGESNGATGWSAGGGASYALDAAWAATIQYRFTRFADRRDSPPFGSRHVHDDASLVLGGITYRFLGL